MLLAARSGKKKMVIPLFLAMFLIMGTWQVSAEGENGELPAEEVVLTVWQTDVWDYTPALQSFVDSVDFPITIHLESVSLGDYADRLKIALASGEVPDLLLFPNWLIPEFARFDGQLTDLNELDAAGAAELKRSLAPGVWSTVNPASRRSISFVPLNTSPSVWYYRTDLFRQAGLPSAPVTVASKFATWNAVDAIGKTFRTKTKRALFAHPESVFEWVLVQKSPVYYDSKGAYIGDRNPQIKKAYDHVAKGLKEGWIGRYETASAAYDNALTNGSFASLLGGHSTADTIKLQASASAGKWAVVPLPEKTVDSGLLSGVIPAKSANPQIAFDIIRHLTEEDVQNWAYNELGLFPASLAALSEEEWLNKKDPFFGNQQLNRMLVQSVKTAQPYTLFAESYPAPAAYRSAIQQLARDPKADPAKIWTTAVKNAKAEAGKK